MCGHTQQMLQPRLFEHKLKRQLPSELGSYLSSLNSMYQHNADAAARASLTELSMEYQRLVLHELRSYLIAVSTVLQPRLT